MHLKRNKSPRSWPLPRKGTKFLVRANHNQKMGIPVLIVLRDMLKVCQNKKEAKKIIHEKKVLINNKIIFDEKYPLVILDVIGLDNKFYRLFFSDFGKFQLKEISKEKAKNKISKIIGKRILEKGVVQLNLSDGRNFIYDNDANLGDSVLVDFEKNQIGEILKVQKGAFVLVVSGKHRGKSGKIETIDDIFEIATENEKINVKINNIMVVKNDYV